MSTVRSHLDDAKYRLDGLEITASASTDAAIRDMAEAIRSIEKAISLIEKQVTLNTIAIDKLNRKP
jgi:hypothetical protein